MDLENYLSDYVTDIGLESSDNSQSQLLNVEI
jgi:hypothetical protein